MHSPPSALDIAAAIIEERPGLDQMQLHKLLYFVQAAALSWFGKPAFTEPIEAWIYGPVARQAAGHYMQFETGPIVKPVSGDSSRVPEEFRKAIRRIVQTYGNLSGLELAKLTKQEGSPWYQVRGNLPENEPSDREIPRELIEDFHKRFGVLPAEPTEEETELAQRFFDGDSSALEKLFERATGKRPTVSR